MESRIKWRGPEFAHWHKGVEWYWAIGISAFGIVLASIILGNYIFAILIIVAVLALVIFSLRGPRLIDVEVNNRGIVLDKYFYSFGSLESFWIEGDSFHPKILFKSNKFWMPYIHLPITEEISIEEVRDFLLQYLEEEELNEPFFQKILEFVGF